MGLREPTEINPATMYGMVEVPKTTLDALQAVGDAFKEIGNILQDTTKSGDGQAWAIKELRAKTLEKVWDIIAKGII